MSKKEVELKPKKPTDEKWVETGRVSTKKPEKDKKRLTMDIPRELHRDMKTQCAKREVTMVDEICAVLTKHFSK